MDITIGGKYRLVRKIGSGSFGDIYQGVDDRDCPVAIKLEKPDRPAYCVLEHEAAIYKTLQHSTSIPEFLWYGSKGGFNILVMEMLDKSLEDLKCECGGTLSVRTVLMLADQMISCLEYMHQKRVIHQDLKPENFMVRDKTLYVIDFGTAKRYKDLTTGQHCQLVGGQEVVGTGRYSSIRTLRGYEQSRRDDLEALGYIFMYLLRGSLPWIGVTGRHTKDRNTKIAKMKSKLTPVLLCQGFPAEFTLYFESVMRLGFEEEPDYAQYRKMFRELGIKEGIPYDYDYDWEHVEDERPAMPKLIPYSQPITRLNTPRKKKRAHMLLEELPTPQRSVTRNGRNAQEKGLSVSIPEMPRLARTSVQSPVHATSDGF